MTSEALFNCHQVSYASKRGRRLEAFSWQGPSKTEEEALERADRALRGTWRLMTMGMKQHLLDQPTIMAGRQRGGTCKWVIKGNLLARGLECPKPHLKGDEEPSRLTSLVMGGDPKSTAGHFGPRHATWKGSSVMIDHPCVNGRDESLDVHVTSSPDLAPETVEAMLAATMAFAVKKVGAVGRWFGSGEASPIASDASATLRAARASGVLSDKAASAAQAVERLKALGFREIAEAYAAACKGGNP